MQTEDDTFRLLSRVSINELLRHIERVPDRERYGKLGTRDSIDEFLKPYGWTYDEFEYAMDKTYED